MCVKQTCRLILLFSILSVHLDTVRNSSGHSLRGLWEGQRFACCIRNESQKISSFQPYRLWVVKVLKAATDRCHFTAVLGAAPTTQ